MQSIIRLRIVSGVVVEHVKSNVEFFLKYHKKMRSDVTLILQEIKCNKSEFT